VQFWRSVVVDPTRSVRDIDLNFVSVSSFWQLIVKGAVLRVAVMAHERNAVFES
jgi:predicted ABC-type sugar transport system permease subunit